MASWTTLILITLYAKQMRLHPTLATLILFATACQEGRRTELPTKQPATTAHSILPCAFTPFDLQQPRYKSYHKLDSVEVVKLATNKDVRLKSFPFYNRFEDFYLAGQTKCGLITTHYVLHKDESCCLTLYFVSASDKQPGSIDCIRAAVVGSDGNWGETDRMTASPRGVGVERLIRVDVDDPNTGEYTAIVETKIRETISIDESGFFIKNRIDSSSVTKKPPVPMTKGE